MHAVGSDTCTPTGCRPKTAVERFLARVEAAVLASRPSGLEAAYIEDFFRRHRISLLRAIVHQFEEMCRLGRLLPGYEVKLGYAFLAPETRQGKLYPIDGSSLIHTLAVKARCHPSDPFTLREYAVHSRRADEAAWRIHPSEDWRASEADAIQAFAENHAHEARFDDARLEEDGDREYGIPDAPYVLTHPVAIDVADGEQNLQASDLERAIKASERKAKEWKRIGGGVVRRSKRKAAARARSQSTTDRAAPSPPHSTEAVVERCVDEDRDPVIGWVIEVGGLRADLVADLPDWQRAKARAIPGLLRPDGYTWEDLAFLKYGDDLDENGDTYLELFMWAMDASHVPDVAS